MFVATEQAELLLRLHPGSLLVRHYVVTHCSTLLHRQHCARPDAVQIGMLHTRISVPGTAVMDVKI